MGSILANTPLATDEETEARLEKGLESGVRDSRYRAWRPLTASAVSPAVSSGTGTKGCSKV